VAANARERIPTHAGVNATHNVAVQIRTEWDIP
jgi:hypothetical protein